MNKQPTIVHLLYESTQKYSDKEVICHQQQKMTYAELWKKVSSLASFLIEQGLKKGDRIGILIENSVDYVVAYYGVLAAGGVTVACNTGAKAKDICNWIKHSEASWLIINAKHAEFSKVLKDLGSEIQTIVINFQSDFELCITPLGSPVVPEV